MRARVLAFSCYFLAVLFVVRCRLVVVVGRFRRRNRRVGRCFVCRALGWR